MPELPEVETIRRQLNEGIAGEEIAQVEVREGKNWVGDSSQVIGRKVAGIARQGKYLFWRFEDGSGLQVHLKMTGRVVINSTWYETAPHTRVVIRFKSGKIVYYWDTRKFGYLRYEKRVGEAEENLKKRLGPEPWKVGEKELLSKLKKTSRTIKDVILDQSILAGVGNIYANDGLWDAGIDPRRRAKSLTLRECQQLLSALKKVMEKGLMTGGASDNSYVDARGQKGKYQDHFLVYGKTKGVCPKCERNLLYVKIGGRGSWYCESCQK